jgi:ribosomal protein S18 acetylase RimI-like enzyme
MEYKKMNELAFCPREQMGAIFADGFYEHGLKFFSKDKEKLAKATAHIFILDKFYAAIEGEEVLAFIGCADKKPPPITLNRKIFTRELGFFRGMFAFIGFKIMLVSHKYPFAMPSQTGSIEFVATAPNHRGKGIAHGLLSYVMETEPFDAYVLEVIDTNAAAIRLYEKLGFSEFQRKPAPKGSGFNFFVYMKST